MCDIILIKMKASTGLASLLGAYNSDSDEEEEVEHLTTSWTTCEDKATGNPYFWNIETKEVSWDQPEELRKYLAYVEQHKDELTRSYGENRFVTHSGLTQGSSFFLDQLLRKVSWEMPTKSATTTTTERNADSPRTQVCGLSFSKNENEGKWKNVDSAREEICILKGQ